MVEIHFEGQHESLPSILDVNIEKDELNCNEDFTLRNNEELEKLKIVDDDAQDFKALVVMGDESTSLNHMK